MKIYPRLVSMLLLLVSFPLFGQTLQGTAFTYQGELRQSGAPVTASADMVFELYDAASGGNPVGSALSFTTANGNPVSVTNGIFTVALDFGALAFGGVVSYERYLKVTVNGNVLAPRTKIENAPYALQARTAELAYGVSNASVGAAQIVANQVQQRVNGTCSAGSSIRTIAQDGTVTCQSDSNSGGTITGVNAGAGLTGGGASGSVSLMVDASTIQARIANSCVAGSSIRAVDAGGAVTCQTDNVGTPVGTTWSLVGNSGTASGNYLGTNDFVPLELRVVNSPALRLVPSGATGIPPVITGLSIIAGIGNTVTAGASGVTISGGGGDNFAPGAPNTASDHGSTISGGSNNVAGNGNGDPSDAVFATVGGGKFNTASGLYSTVAGGGAGTSGFGNTASGGVATVGGGVGNTAGGQFATIAGGAINIASAAYSTISGGYTNTASGSESTVTGGFSNIASGDYAIVSGGYSNVAGGDLSFAGGTQAHVRTAGEAGVSGGDKGSFVWADANFLDFLSDGPNRFLVRAIGGAKFVSAINGSGSATAGVQLAPGGGSWSSLSDRNFKTNISAINPRRILDAVLGMAVSHWNYFSQGSSIRHIGPMAQDFYAAFGVGEDDRHITTVDADGVALAAIQGLNAKLESENARLSSDIALLAGDNAELRKRLDSIETQLQNAASRP